MLVPVHSIMYAPLCVGQFTLDALTLSSCIMIVRRRFTQKSW